MANAHYFMIDDLRSFLDNLESREFERSVLHENDEDWIVYGKTMSGALTKFYGFTAQREVVSPIRIRVTYTLIKEAKPLAKLAAHLKRMNEKYRKSLPGWKTRPETRQHVRDKRWDEIQHFLQAHGELIECFKYQSDDRMTEGAHVFNLQIASTPREQKTCFEFIKALAEAFAPHGIIRGRREADKPRQQRNGWIKRYADMHRKRGWSPLEIAREIQKELRNGTWNERSRLQYNLSNNTIAKIAGLKLQTQHAHASLN
jgi:hypothetical protein